MYPQVEKPYLKSRGVCMKILVSGGGTAGHINPAIAIAKRMKNEYNAEILFIGRKNGMEDDLVQKEGFEIKYIEVLGLIRKLTLENFKVLAKYVTAINTAKKIIKEFNPDVVVGTGGYVCAPVLYAAHSLKIPTLVHEQNVFPGMTVKMASGYVNCVATAFSDMNKYVSEKVRKKCVLTGNPLRENLFDLSYFDARKKLGIGNETFIVTVGGSLGARTINNALVDIINNTKADNVKILGGTGERFYDEVIASIDKEKLGKNVEVLPYIYNMNEVLPAADLIVARSGAVTVSELCALGRPAILIPSPNVTHNHQEYNANSVASRGGAVMIPERDLGKISVTDTVNQLLGNPEKLAEMSEKAKARAISDGTKRICDIVAELARK